MPTGYTAAVQEGEITELKDFIWHCARAFGAFVMQRDDDADAPLNLKEEYGKYYVDRLAETRLNLKEYELYSNAEWRKVFIEYRDGLIRECIESIARKEEERRRYESMLDKVEKWMPPSRDHLAFKDFMVQQLEESIIHDCSVDYYADRIKDVSEKTWESFKYDMLEGAKKDIDYYEAELKKEIGRVDGRNLWKEELVKSVGLPNNFKE